MTSFERTAYKLFKNPAKKAAESKPELERLLISANMRTIPEVFMATKMFTAAIVGGVMALVTLVIWVVMGAMASSMDRTNPAMAPMMHTLALALTVIMALLTVLVPVLIFYLAVPMLNGKVKARAKAIDKMLPYAVNYMAALSSAEVSPAFIFRGLATQDIYGEMKSEAMNIVRDMDVLGKDIITSIHNAIDRSPSIKLQDFLQGIVTTVTSGGSLNIYFQSKSEQYMKENRVEQKGTLETLAVMGESFVTVVIVMPLLLIIIMSIMALMGGSGGEMFILWVIVGFMIPASQGMFVFVISGIEL